MKRRNFIKNVTTAIGAGTVSIPFAKGIDIIPTADPTLTSNINTENDKVFILIQLIGGNDGLNTVIPLDAYDNLANLRGNVLVKENKILKLKPTDKIGFHPALDGFYSLYNEGQLSIIQNVGYPNQNRSHFRSMDIWNSASPATEMWSSGWLGRYLDTLHKNYPVNYPNAAYPNPLAITMGNIVADSCQGKINNFSYALSNIKTIVKLNEYEDRSDELTEYLKELSFLNSSIKLSNQYTETITTASEKGNNLAAYPEDNVFAQQLKIVAKLISGGLQTKIYVLTIGGWDTHAYQTTEDTSIGWHASLLKILSDGIRSFQNDLRLLQLEDRVIGMTYSEFGRQIKSNSANGTDHGTAAPLFVFGKNIKYSIFGNNPVIDKKVPDQEGVKMIYDFRDVYGSVLTDWFDLKQEITKDIFRKASLYYPLIKKTTKIS